MGKELYDNHKEARELFDTADRVLGFELSKIMFEGTQDELKQTKVTQPAIFTMSVITAKLLGNEFQPDMVAGHSLGEFSALCAASALNFTDALTLVSKRTIAMQKACEQNPSTMAAILGLEDEVVENMYADIDGVVVAANYNCQGSWLSQERSVQWRSLYKSFGSGCASCPCTSSGWSIPQPTDGACQSRVSRCY